MKPLYIAGALMAAAALGAGAAVVMIHATAPAESANTTATAADITAQMAYIPGGEYTPLYTESDADGGVLAVEDLQVSPYLLDREAVTEEQYLEFVRANPRWRRSAVGQVMADTNYLMHWHDDLTPNTPEAPVVNVSWFAARSYCRWRGKTLPTVAQWEFAAMADENSPTAVRDSEDFRNRILTWYATPAGDGVSAPQEAFENFYGVRNMHGVIWEWTSDFNNALVTGASRSDSSASRNLFCGGGALAATDFDDYAAFMRFAFRSSLSGNYTVSSLGFRCARNDAEEI